MTVHGERARNLLHEGKGQADAYLSLSPYNRYYLTGFSGSQGAVLVAPEEYRWLLCDFRYTEQAASQAPDYEIVPVANDLFKRVGALAHDVGAQRIAFEADHLTVEEWNRLTEAVPDIAWIPVSGMTEKMRMIKTPDEIVLLRRAAQVASTALSMVLATTIRPGISERQVALSLELAMRESGADRLSFDTIVASGPRGSLPHGQPSTRILEPGDYVTIDFGAVVGGYHSDETVTVVLPGSSSTAAEMRQIYEIVFAAQQAGLEAVKSGTPVSAVDRAARRVIEAAGFGAQFGHGTGHGVGLEVHEPPYLSWRAAPDDVLQSGMAITVEPGIYLPNIGGVRLEDTVMVTDQGYQRLTTVDKAWRVL